MFHASQHWYDLVYDAQGKDYAAEAGRIREILAGQGIAEDRLGRPVRWLDVACGTGRHLAELPGLDRVGVDLDGGMLEIARRRCPGVAFLSADMRQVDRTALGPIEGEGPDGRFDVVSCLFSAIAYMPDPASLEDAVRSMADRVGEGGMLLIEPFLAPAEIVGRRPWMNVVDRDDLKLVRMDVPRVDGRRLELEFHYLIGDADGVEHVVEPHVVTLFDREEIGRAFEAAGLEWTFDPKGLGPRGRGLHVGRRPSGRAGGEPPSEA